jgi:hypothetical protein
MAYLSIKRVKRFSYIYVVRSERKGGKVRPRILEYLGRADKVDPKRLRRACDYWGVKQKPRKRRR